MTTTYEVVTDAGHKVHSTTDLKDAMDTAIKFKRDMLSKSIIGRHFYRSGVTEFSVIKTEEVYSTKDIGPVTRAAPMTVAEAVEPYTPTGYPIGDGAATSEPVTQTDRNLANESNRHAEDTLGYPR